MEEAVHTNEKAESATEIIAKNHKERARLKGECDRIQFHWSYEVLWTVGGFAISFIVTWRFQTPSLSGTFLHPFLLLTALSVLIYPLSIWLEKMALRMQIDIHEKFISEIEKEQLQTILTEDFFNNLVKLNYKYLDQYYAQTQAQANKSFVLTATVATIAVSIIILGVILMFLGTVAAAAVTTGAGVLSEFIAAVFFYFYNRTVTKMGQYHQKLVITQNIALAMKIAEELPEADRVASQKELISRLTDNVNKYLSEFPHEKSSARS